MISHASLTEIAERRYAEIVRLKAELADARRQRTTAFRDGAEEMRDRVCKAAGNAGLWLFAVEVRGIVVDPTTETPDGEGVNG